MRHAMPPRRTRVVVAAVATILTLLIGSILIRDLGAPSNAQSSAGGSGVVAAGPSPSGRALTDLLGRPLEPVPLPTPEPSASADVTPPPTGQAKNVVMLLADDLDWYAFEQVPRLKALKDKGVTLTNYVVTDSLCCPSRSSIYRSQYVHNHRVISNGIKTGGGWAKFHDLGHENDCLPTWLSSAGVQTAHVGKYLNGFPGKRVRMRSYVPPGWDHFTTPVNGNIVYTGYGYRLSTDGQLSWGGPTFLNDALTADATSWLQQAQAPFYLELNTYVPHTPAPSSVKNRGTRYGTGAPQPPSFNRTGLDPAPWQQGLKPLSIRQMESLNGLWSRRLESAETFADSVDAVLATLKATGHADDTLVIVTSDNGYHAGVHRMLSGKHSPYREDTVVPTVLIGPGMRAGTTIDALTSTIDLGPTIAAYMNAQTPAFADGRNLLPLIEDPTIPWRTGLLTESLSTPKKGDPDYEKTTIPKFHALRTHDWLYVSYGKYASLYNLVTDPFEMNNVIKVTDPTTVANLRAQLQSLVKCAGPTCRIADMLPSPSAPGTPSLIQPPPFGQWPAQAAPVLTPTPAPTPPPTPPATPEPSASPASSPS
ncbi:MAG: sulfatase-like hydrolase/transferase [Actinomycetales bacterium]|nr:sulfatase-like hydrolase/transferase [Actinomycetales bacterium]